MAITRGATRSQTMVLECAAKRPLRISVRALVSRISATAPMNGKKYHSAISVSAPVQSPSKAASGQNGRTQKRQKITMPTSTAGIPQAWDGVNMSLRRPSTDPLFSLSKTCRPAKAPALFTFSPQGGRYVSAFRAAGVYIASPNLISGLATVPAKPGDTVLLFGTGFGPTTPPSPIGQLINPAPLANPVTVRIGGVVAITQFAGIVSPGEYQFNIVVPNVSNGDNAVSIKIGGGTSPANRHGRD